MDEQRPDGYMEEFPFCIPLCCLVLLELRNTLAESYIPIQEIAEVLIPDEDIIEGMKRLGIGITSVPATVKITGPIGADRWKQYRPFTKRREDGRKERRKDAVIAGARRTLKQLIDVDEHHTLIVSRRRSIHDALCDIRKCGLSLSIA